MRTYLSHTVAYLVECGASHPSTAQGTQHQMWSDQRSTSFPENPKPLRATLHEANGPNVHPAIDR